MARIEVRSKLSKGVAPVLTAHSMVAGEGTVESVFCQNFTAGLPGIGETVSVALKEDGDDIMVTEENRREYVDLFVDFYLNSSVNKQVSCEATVQT